VQARALRLIIYASVGADHPKIAADAIASVKWRVLIKCIAALSQIPASELENPLLPS
jgi:hypothetical protein